MPGSAAGPWPGPTPAPATPSPSRPTWAAATGSTGRSPTSPSATPTRTNWIMRRSSRRSDPDGWKRLKASEPGRAVRLRNETGRRFHQGDLGAEVTEDRGELAAGVGAADHHDRRRQPGQVAQPVEGARELGAGNRAPASLRLVPPSRLASTRATSAPSSPSLQGRGGPGWSAA